MYGIFKKDILDVSLRLRDRFFTNEYCPWLNFSSPFLEKSKARAEIIQIYISQIFIDNFIYLTQTFMFYVFIFKHEFEIIATLLKINIHKKKYTIFDLFYICIKLFSINLINKSSSISSSKYFISIVSIHNV